ncbi:MAG: HlyD family efflux transporter periplasmic adaptor subunit [Chloroflexota bacterium]|nr:HlyD family efflux transporter periplasmic adaptor subunit [Chloroflexota bacterium]
MAALFAQIRRLHDWQLIALVLVVVGTSAGGIFAYTNSNSSDSETLVEGQQFVEVKKGDLTRQVTSNGSIVFPNRQSLFFGSQGTVEEVSVEVGDQVQTGQILARLDDDTLAQLQKDLAQAQVNLQDAADAYALAQEPQNDLELAKARAAIASAEFKLDQSTDALADIQEPVTLTALEELQSHKATATSALESTQNDLAFQQVNQASKVQDATDALSNAKADYQVTINKFLGITLVEAEYGTTPDEFLSSHAINLDFLFATLQRDDKIHSVLAFTPELVEDPDTDWSEFTVYTWLSLYPGNIYGTCAKLTLGKQDICVRTEIDKSWEALDQAASAWTAADTTAAKTISASLKAVDTATTVLNTAVEKLQTTLDGVNSLEIVVKQHDMEVASAQLEDANETLADLIALPDKLTLALKKAELNAATAKVGTAEQQLELAVLTAPFDGFISKVGVVEGRTSGANNLAFEVVDPSIAEVDARLDEIDVLMVRVGADALVTLDGLPGPRFPGVVTNVSPIGTNQQGVVTFPVRIQVQTPGRLRLREQMNATARIVIEQESDVLLIPSTSIAGTIEQPLVLVSQGDTVAEREVTLGISDGFWTIALTGLEEGDMVVSTTQGGSANPFSNFASLRRGLGGMSGGSFGSQGRSSRGQGSRGQPSR